MVPISGGIAINKQEGLTSFQVTERTRRLFGATKAGHTGTLDGHATGVLVVMLGASTKLIPYLEDKPKKYTATFRLGATSNTYDAWGEVTEHGYKSDIPKDHIQAIISEFTGKIDQIPPMFSAKKVEGIRLYQYAMKGVELPRKPQPVEIISLNLTSYDQNTGEGGFELTCSKGTYVRSLIADIGQNAGCGAIMTSLVRREDHGLAIENSHKISNIEEHIFIGDHLDLVIPSQWFVSHLPEVQVTQHQSDTLWNGNPVNLRGMPARSGLVRIAMKEKLVGIGKLVTATGQLIPERLL